MRRMIIIFLFSSQTYSTSSRRLAIGRGKLERCKENERIRGKEDISKQKRNIANKKGGREKKMMVKWMKMKETPKKGDRSRRTLKKKEKAQIKNMEQMGEHKDFE